MPLKNNIQQSACIAAIPALAVFLAGCGGGESQAAAAATAAPVIAAPSSSTVSVPFPTTGPNRVEGVVFDYLRRPVAGDVNLWVDLGGGSGYSYWWANGRLASDADGRFVAPNLPASTARITAFSDDFRQPCAVAVDAAPDRRVDVEVLSVASLDTLDPPRPLSAVDRFLSGRIYESTAEGRRLVTGAELWVEYGVEVWVARTRSDLGGAYFLCNLPSPVWLHVSKPGFKDTAVGPFDVRGSLELDVAIDRE